jgi:hypothetical protein
MTCWGSIHVKSSVFAQPELGAPWGLVVANRGATFHIIARGSCWLAANGLEPLKLSGGEFVLMAQGDPMRCGTRRPRPLPLADVLAQHGRNPGGVFRYGGNGPLTKLVCGTLWFDDRATDPLLAVMPKIVHVKRTGAGAAPWLYATLVYLRPELSSGRPGAAAVVSRLTRHGRSLHSGNAGRTCRRV